MFKAQPSFWHMLLPALGLHGLLLAYPIETKGGLEVSLPKPGKSVRIMTLPAAPLAKTQKATVRKPINPLSKVQRASTLKLKSAVAQKVVIPAPKPKLLASKLQPSPKPTPSTTPTPSATPTPTPINDFQVEGAAAGCADTSIQDCFALKESDGRLVASRIEESLRKKDYDLAPLDLEDEHGMKVYQLSKRGQPKQGQSEDYLHVFWDEQGTTYLRFPKVLSYQELVLKTRQ